MYRQFDRLEAAWILTVGACLAREQSGRGVWLGLLGDTREIYVAALLVRQVSCRAYSRASASERGE